MKQDHILQQQKGKSSILLYFLCGIAVTAICAATASLISLDDSRISVYAAPEPVRASIPDCQTAPADMELAWTPAPEITSSRDITNYVKGNGSTCFIISDASCAGPVASGPLSINDKNDPDNLSLWIRVYTQHGDITGMYLETDNGTIIPIDIELDDTSWHRVSWEPETAPAGTVTLKVDNDEFRGYIWLDVIESNLFDNNSHSFDYLASPPSEYFLKDC